MAPLVTRFFIYMYIWVHLLWFHLAWNFLYKCFLVHQENHISQDLCLLLSGKDECIFLSLNTALSNIKSKTKFAILNSMFEESEKIGLRFSDRWYQISEMYLLLFEGGVLSSSAWRPLPLILSPVIQAWCFGFCSQCLARMLGASKATTCSAQGGFWGPYLVMLGEGGAGGEGGGKGYLG